MVSDLSFCETGPDILSRVTAPHMPTEGTGTAVAILYFISCQVVVICLSGFLLQFHCLSSQNFAGTGAVP